MLTQKELKEILDYDKNTGIFRWKTRQGSQSKGNIAGSITSHKYLGIGIYRNVYYSHRLAWLYVYGYFPENDIDHINRQKSDNRIKNLREVTRTCNIRNSDNRNNNTSGIKGVYRNKLRSKWYAQIGINGTIASLGYYNDFDNAVCARLAAEQALKWDGCDSSSPAYQYVKERILPRFMRKV